MLKARIAARGFTRRARPAALLGLPAILRIRSPRVCLLSMIASSPRPSSWIPASQRPSSRCFSISPGDRVTSASIMWWRRRCAHFSPHIVALSNNQALGDVNFELFSTVRRPWKALRVWSGGIRDTAELPLLADTKGRATRSLSACFSRLNQQSKIYLNGVVSGFFCGPGARSFDRLSGRGVRAGPCRAGQCVGQYGPKPLVQLRPAPPA